MSQTRGSPSSADEPNYSTMASPRIHEKNETRLALLMFAAAWAVSFWFALDGWTNPLLDTHPFRQTQTAISTYWMLRDGFSIQYETPVFGAPWSVPFEFPLYQGIVAAVSAAFDIPLDPAGRTVALAFFYAGLPAIWLLLRRLAVQASHRWIFLALMVTSPVYIFYSRAFLIESTAFTLCAWFLYFFHVALSTPKVPPLVAAGIFAALGGLVKVTTLAVFLAAAAVFFLAALRTRRDAWKSISLRAVAACAPGVVAATWWVHFTDTVKQRNLFGALETSTALREWHYGTLEQRLSGAYWSQIGHMLERTVLPSATLLLTLVLGLLFMRRQIGVWLIALAIALAGPLVFANLYFVHDYYFYACGVFFLVLVALPLRSVLLSGTPLVARFVIVATVLVAQFAGYTEAYHTAQSRAAFVPPPIATGIKLVTAPDEILLGIGLNWSAVFPYYAERRALMIPDSQLTNESAISAAVAQLGDARIGAVVFRRGVQPAVETFAPLLEKLGLDPTGTFATGDYQVHVRKENRAHALTTIAAAKPDDLWIADAALANAASPRLEFSASDIPDRSLLAHMSPTPTRVVVPFGLSQEIVEGRPVFNAPASSEIEISLPPHARRITARYGIHPAAYPNSDGVQFEVLYRPRSGTAPALLFRRFLQPWLMATDQGPQQLDITVAVPLDGTVIFQTGPGPNLQPNYDWSYWGDIEVR